MFFKPQLWEKGNAVTISDKAKINGAFGYGKEVLENIVKEYGVKDGTIDTFTICEGAPEGATVDIGEEGYAIIISGNIATLYYVSDRSLIYAAVTIEQMCVSEELCEGRLEDAPDCEWRGYRLYLPGRENFDNFKKLIKLMAYYKYNILGLEVGGAMEYKRRPEINVAWKKFVDEVRSIPGRAKQIQFSQTWPKDSIHAENADGEILTQDEVRSLVEYARAHGIEVFPEAPTFSHTDYLCLAYPEIAERQDDPYPDTYCPNHPDTYKIVFDVLEEVIDVFKPKYLHIGHDELYSFGVCDKCKDTAPHYLMAADIIRIHDFLAERGVRTMMWGDKLLPVIQTNGRAVGGAGMDYVFDTDGVRRSCPGGYWVQGMLPRDIIMHNWFYSYGIQYDYVYHTHGYDMIYGNLSVEGVEEWRRRKQLGAKGGIISNWGAISDEFMQRNGQFKGLILSSYALWSKEYDTPMKDQLTMTVFEEAIRQHYGKMGDGSYISVTHSTTKGIPFRMYHCGSFIVDKDYHMGKYVLTYDDGTTAEFEVKYGINILSEKTPMKILGEICGEESDTFAEFNLSEVCYSALPVRKFGKTCFKTFFKNPHPEKRIESFVYVSECDTPVELIAYERV